MASELRVNTSTNRVGLGTITYTDTGPIISGITTGNNFKTGTTNVHSTGVELANINTGGSTATFGGDLSIPDTIVHTGDTNTKIRFPSADTFSVETAGLQNFKVNGTRVALTSPSGTNTTLRLQHQGNSGYGDIILDRTVNAFIIDNDPSNASNNQSYFSVKNKGTENLRIAYDGKSTFSENVTIVKTSGPLLELTTNTGAADATLRLSEGSTGSTTNGGGMFYSGADNKLYITCGTNSTTKRITINRDDGKIGMGIAAPLHNLHIKPPTASETVLKIEAESGYDARLKLDTSSGGGAEARIDFEEDASIRGWISYTNNSGGTTDDMVFGTATNERLRIKSDGTSLFTGKITNSSSFTSHNTNFYGGNVNTGGVRIEVAHSTTSVSGNTASASFPHHLLLSNYSGNGSADNRMCSIGFDIPTTSTHANAVIAYQATAAGTGDLQFHLESGNSISEKLRIKSTGEVRIGANSTAASTAGDDLVIEGTSDRGLSIIAGTSSSSNIYFGDSGDADIGRMAYQHNDNALDFSVNAGTTRLRIHQNGITVWGNDNYFYGGGGGTNLNGDLKIRSTGTAVYQSLKFLSSDGSNQSQILGYGGGAILFFYSSEFVWGINNQGERLNLTNTSLRPRDTSTVLDLGTTTRRYRRTYTDGITVNTSNTNTKFCINGGSSANVMTIRNTTGGNGNVGILFSTQDHSGGREKAAIYHQETHGQAHYGGDFIFCLANSTGGAAQVTTSDERLRIMRSGDVQFGDNPHNSLWSASNHAGTYYRKAQGSLASATRANTGYSSYYINKNTGAGGSEDRRWIDFYWNSSHYGRIEYNGASGTNYNTSSDYRLKENVVSITDGIAKVKQLKPYRFNFKSDTTDKVVQGFFAHEAQEVVPYAVSGTKDEVVTQGAVDEGSQPEEKVVGDPIYQDVDYGKFTPILTAALQEAILKIEVLEAKVATLESS